MEKKIWKDKRASKPPIICKVGSAKHEIIMIRLYYNLHAKKPLGSKMYFTYKQQGTKTNLQVKNRERVSQNHDAQGCT
jgi:hypothetical protein